MQFTPYQTGQPAFARLETPTAPAPEKTDEVAGVSEHGCDEPPEKPELPSADAQLEAAREAGRQESRNAIEEERQQLRQAIDSVNALHQELVAARDQTLRDSAEAIATIVRSFTHRITAQTLALHPDALPGLVKDVCAQLSDSEPITIAVCPADAERLAQRLDGPLRDAVVVDASLSAGVSVRTPTTRVDATLATAMENLELAIQTWLREQWWSHDEDSP